MLSGIEDYNGKNGSLQHWPRQEAYWLGGYSIDQKDAANLE